jgi:hypothetical protein
MANHLQIMPDIYSGRPNPQLDLSPNEIDELRRLIERGRDQPVIEEARENLHLGYRGFVILNPRREHDLPFSVRIFNGTIDVIEEVPVLEERRPAAPLRYRDSENIEGWLLARAADRGLMDDIIEMGGPKIGEGHR